jgi:RIO kinase 1
MTRPAKLREIEEQIDVLRERIKDADDYKVKDNVFDTRTLMNLYALSKKGIIEALGGAVSSGKEANIYHAIGEKGDLALKIYRISTSNFKAMQDYLLGDPRFGSIKGTKRSVIITWTRKEFRNLKRAEEAGVRVPSPIAIRENILVMEFIGEEEVQSPQLKDVTLDEEEAKRVFNKIADFIAQLYGRAELVHGDLSEYNILYDGEPVIIDMGQSVTLDHPMAKKFFDRDINNIARYFNKKYKIGSPEAILEKVNQFAH